MASARVTWRRAVALRPGAIVLLVALAVTALFFIDLAFIAFAGAGRTWLAVFWVPFGAIFVFGAALALRHRSRPVGLSVLGGLVLGFGSAYALFVAYWLALPGPDS